MSPFSQLLNFSQHTNTTIHMATSTSKYSTTPSYPSLITQSLPTTSLINAVNSPPLSNHFLPSQQSNQQDPANNLCLVPVLNSSKAHISEIFDSQLDQVAVRHNGATEQIQTKLHDIDKTLKSHSRSITALHSTTPSAARISTPTILNYQSINADTFELLISGLPVDLQVTPLRAAVQVSSSLKLHHLTNDILSAEKFPRPKLRGEPSQHLLQSQQTPQHQPPSKLQTSSNCIVVSFKSTVSRNHVTKQIAKFGKLTLADIFTNNSSAPIYTRPLYPQAFHRLYQAAIRKSQELGYASPKIRDSTIHIRSNSRSPSTKIYCTSDLENPASSRLYSP